MAPSGWVLPYSETLANVVGIAPSADGASWGTTADALPRVNPVVIGAHYDTVPGSPGADDNAAAVAVVLEVAARLVARPAARPVVAAIFDAEEPPYFHSDLMGSVRFVADQLGGDAHAAIVLDLIANHVGIPNLEGLVGVMGSESHHGWPDIVRPVARALGPVLTLPNALMPDMSDHYAFRLARRPFLFLSAGQGQHYHRPTDTPANADMTKAARVADMLERLTRAVAATDWDGSDPHDPSEFDLERLREVLGPEALNQLNVRSPRDAHEALRRLVSML